MRIHNVYTDDDGESHFRDVEVEWALTRGSHKLSDKLPVGGLIFRETDGDNAHDLAWHPAPQRQYVINLNAGVVITTSDGEAREIGAGEVLLVEDITGKGHLAQAVGEQVRHSLIIPLD